MRNRMDWVTFTREQTKRVDGFPGAASAVLYP